MILFHLLLLFLVNNTNALKRSNLKMTNTNFMEDLNIIRNYKNLLEKDNYNNIIQHLLDNKVDKLFINNDYREIVSVDNSDIIYHVASINPIVVPNLIEKTSEIHVPIYFIDFDNKFFNIQNLENTIGILFSYTVPIFFTIMFISFLRNIAMISQNPMSKGPFRGPMSNGPFGFLQKNSNDKIVKPNVTLDSWAGSPEVMTECKEIINYVENKEKYKQIGADMPKGILLEGPPGTGKTLLAKAIATATNSTFISISASEFVELFVGMGAARVRELFSTARENKPSIIFIDEIDAIGRQRGAGINMGNDEREQTLNQMLYEMDGFNDNEDLIIMAATNRRDVLDQALLRPGRFDRIITVPLPDKPSREKILEVYLRDKTTDKPFDISAISELTDGFSGAQLKNLINEAAIISARNNYTIIQEKYIFEAFEKSIVGLIKTNATVAPSTQLRVSLHEAGHALLVLHFSEYFDLKKVSIQPTYNGAGGYTIFSEKPEIKEGGLYTKDLLKKRLIISMGGKAAETIYYGSDFVSIGAIQDLNQANNLAKRMVGNFGMGNQLEVFYNEDIGDDTNPFLGRRLAMGDKYSERTRYMMDKESLELVKEAFNEAKTILKEKRGELIDFSEMLRNSSTLSTFRINPLLEKVEQNLTIHF